MSNVLGILGHTLPPLASSKHMKHARDSLVLTLAEALLAFTRDTDEDISYALVTLDRETGPWICNYLRKMKIPFITVEAEGQLFTNKLRYWRNQALDRIVVPLELAEGNDALMLAATGRWPGAEKKRLPYLIRNQWVIQKSDWIFHCCLPSSHLTGIRFYLGKKLLEMERHGEKRVKMWQDQAVTQLLKDSHDQRKKRQKKKHKFGKKPFGLDSANKSYDDVPF